MLQNGCKSKWAWDSAVKTLEVGTESVYCIRIAEVNKVGYPDICNRAIHNKKLNQKFLITIRSLYFIGLPLDHIWSQTWNWCILVGEIHEFWWNLQISKSESVDFKFEILLESTDFNETHSHLPDLNRETS